MERNYLLPEKIDRNKIYYKITNIDENHNGLQYHDGLVEDIVPFNDDPNASCVKGGIYFTTLEHLPAFFDYGVWIRPLIIPEDARVILDPGEDKYRADKVYMLPRIPLNRYITDFFDYDTYLWDWYGEILFKYFKYDFDKWWNPDKFNWEKYSYVLAYYCYNYFDKWWDPDKFNWEKYSWTLAKYCAKYFDKWWDKRFNWNDKEYLMQYCSDYFEKWFYEEDLGILNTDSFNY